MGGINLSANINFGQWLMELTDEGDVWAFFYAATTGDMPQLDQRTLYPMIVDRDNVQYGLGGTVPVDTAVVDAYGLRTNGAYVQECQYSEDPGEWVLLRATRIATGETFGPFIEYEITDGASGSAIYDRAYLWESAVSGSPTGIIYFNVCYRAGTSENIMIFCYDMGASSSSTYKGAIGSATITGNDAGTLTIISDEYNAKEGYYELKGSMLFTNLSNTLTIGIGPNSDDNSNIKVLGADVSENIAALSIHTASSGSNVSVGANNSYDDSGTLKGPHFSDGPADGVEEIVNSNMELDSDWPNTGSPTTNEQSSTQAHSGAYSRHVVANNAILSGIEQEIDVVVGQRCEFVAWVYLVQGDVQLDTQNSYFGADAVAYTETVASSWQKLTFRGTSLLTGTTKTFVRANSISTAVEFYVDDVSVKQVTKIGLAQAYPQLFSVLDGKADGVQLVTNSDCESAVPTMNGVSLGNFNATPTQSTEQAHSGTTSVKCTKTNTTENASIRFEDNEACGVLEGNYYEQSVWVYLPSGQTIDRLDLLWQSAGSDVLLDYTEVTDTWVKLLGRFTDNDGRRCLWVRGANDSASAEYWYVDDFSVKQISPATGIITDTIRFGFGYGDVPNNSTENILTFSGNELFPMYLRKNSVGASFMLLRDGVSTTQVAMDWKAFTDYRYKIVHGMHPTDTLSADKVVDGGFETAGAGGADIWANWIEVASDGAIANETSIVHSGSDAAKITAGSLANTVIYQSFTVIPGESYIHSFWTRGDGTNAGRYRVYDDTNTADIVGITSTGVTGTNYTEVTVEFTAPSGCTSVSVHPRCPTTNGGIAYFDDVSVKMQNQPKMQLQVDELTDAGAVEESWVSAVTDFAGTWSPGDALSFGYDNAYPMNPTRKLLSRGPVRDTDWKVAT